LYQPLFEKEATYK